MQLFEVTHVDGLVYHQPLNLMEHRRMGDVVVTAVGSPRRQIF